MITPDFDARGRTVSKQGASLVVTGPPGSSVLRIDVRLSPSKLTQIASACNEVEALFIGVKCDLRDLTVLEFFPKLLWLDVCCQDKMTSLFGLEYAPHLEHLMFNGPLGLSLHNISFLSSLSDLRLDAGKKIDSLNFSALSNLRRLHVVQAGFRDLEFLKSLPQLQHLRLSGCSVKNWNGLREAHSLVGLALVHCQSDRLDFITMCANVRELDLSACHRATDMSFIQRLTMLEELILTEKGRVKDIRFLRSLPKLRRLRVVGIRPDAFCAADFDNLPNLRELQIGKWADPCLGDIQKRLSKDCSVQYFRM